MTMIVTILRDCRSLVLSAKILALTVLFASLSACTHTQVINEDSSQASIDLSYLEEAPRIIPRSMLFDEPGRSRVRLSPDGAFLSYVAPHEGALNIWVTPINNLDATAAVTRDAERGIRDYQWAYTSRHIVYLQDVGSDNNRAAFRLDLSTGDIIPLSPTEGVNAQIIGLSPNHPEEVLIGINKRDPRLFDVHRVNINTGRSRMVLRNPGYTHFLADHNLNIRLGSRMTRSGGQVWMKMERNGSWSPFIEVDMEDINTTRLLDFDESNQSIHLIDSRDSDTAVLASIDLQTGERSVVFSDPRADVNDALLHPKTGAIQGAAVQYTRNQWHLLDSVLEHDFDVLGDLGDGDVVIAGRSQDDDVWIVGILFDDTPAIYYLYHRNQNRADYLFSWFPRLEVLDLSSMESVVIRSRDGLDLVSYLTLPHFVNTDENRRPLAPLPMVIHVHDGPWERNTWGFNLEHQWLANRGYAVLSVNFRGSSGYGKDFLRAGNREWGAAMHQDLIDAVQWAVSEEIAHPEHIAIYGAGYGGYAALTGLAVTPETFACGVNLSGPSNLITLMESLPANWEAMIDLWADRVGDHRTEEGRSFLTQRSPLTHVDRVQRPLLIGQGARDRRVKASETKQLVDRLQDRYVPVTCALYPEEGNGLQDRTNRISFYALAEAFLSDCLGGRFEPIAEDLKDLNLEIIAGADLIPGLSEALGHHAQEPEVMEGEAIETGVEDNLFD